MRDEFFGIFAVGLEKMKTAIIIGATSGIGREVAIRLIEQGWKVGLAGRREERMADIQGKFGASQVTYAVIDITKADSTAALDGLLGKTGAPDLFLHCSGIGNQNPQIDEDVEMRVIQTNCNGMVRMVAHFMNYIKAHPEAYNKEHKAHIAVITSVAGTNGLGISAAYSASKKMQSTYLTGLAQLSSMEKIPVIFSDIRPGFVATEILDPNQHYPFIMTADKAAGYILKDLKRHKRIITFDWRFRAIVVLWHLIPRFIWERLTIVKTK